MIRPGSHLQYDDHSEFDEQEQGKPKTFIILLAKPIIGLLCFAKPFRYDGLSFLRNTQVTRTQLHTRCTHSPSQPHTQPHTHTHTAQSPVTHTPTIPSNPHTLSPRLRCTASPSKPHTQPHRLSLCHTHTASACRAQASNKHTGKAPSQPHTHTHSPI